MISVVMKIIECAVAWLSENYHIEVKEHLNGYGFTIKLRQTNKQLTKW